MYLFGASGHSKVIIEILEKNNLVVEGLYDDNPDIIQLLSYPVKKYAQEHVDGLIISIGNNQIRKSVANAVNANFSKAIHPLACISQRSNIGFGSVVMAGGIVNVETNIGEHCIINTNASIDHDCKIADYVHISPGVTICGGVRIDEGTHIGAGTTVLPNLSIGKWCVIAAGAVIHRDIPDYSMVMGVPGRIIKSTLK